MEKIELNKEISSLITKIKSKFDKMNAENDPASDPWLILTEVEMLYQKLIVLKYVHETERKKRQMETFSNSEAIEDLSEERVGSVILDGTDDIQLKTEMKKADPLPASSIQATQPVTDFKKLMGFNEKILFTRELFKNSASDFERAVTEIDQCIQLSDAEKYIKAQIVVKNGIDSDSEVLESFLSLVKRRFASQNPK